MTVETTTTRTTVLSRPFTSSCAFQNVNVVQENQIKTIDLSENDYPAINTQQQIANDNEGLAAPTTMAKSTTNGVSHPAKEETFPHQMEQHQNKINPQVDEADGNSDDDYTDLEQQQLQQAITESVSTATVVPGAFAIQGPNVGRNDDWNEISDSVVMEASNHDNIPVVEALYHHVLAAHKVDEVQEKKRLEEAEELGRRHVWKKVRAFALAVLVILLSMAVLLLAILLPKQDNSSPLLNVDERFLPPQISTSVHPTTTAPLASESFPPFISPTSLYPSIVPSHHTDNNNYNCLNAIVLETDGVNVSGTVPTRSDEYMVAYEACSPNSWMDEGLVSWYKFYAGNHDLDIELTLCGDPNYWMVIYTGECTSSMENAELVCAFDYMPFDPICITHRLSLLPDTDYYLMVAMASTAPAMMGSYTFSLRPVTNDHCGSSTEIMAIGTVQATTRFAMNHTVNTTCGILDGGGMWYQVIGTGNTLSFDTCQYTAVRTVVSVFTGDCNQLECVYENGNGYGSCWDFSEVGWLSVLNQVYYIRVHGITPGAFTLTGRETEPYDVCQGARRINATGVYNGSTANATLVDDLNHLPAEFLPPASRYAVMTPGVWYTIEGNGATVTVSSCTESTDSVAPTIWVLSGACDTSTGTLTQTSYDYGPCGPNSESSATWITEAGIDYYLFVFAGYASTVAVDFELNVTIT